MPEIVKLLVVVLSTLFGAMGNYFFKLSASRVERPADALRIPHLYVGGAVYSISTLLYIWSHRILQIYTVIAISSLTYVWTMLIAHFLLKEKVGSAKIIGAALIILGTVLSVTAKYMS